MSLRARLLVGMAVVAVVLVGAAVFIARSTEADLVARVDDQLRSADVSPGRFRPGPEADQAPSSLFIGVVRGDTVRTYVTPNFTGEDAVPAIPVERVAAVADDGVPRLFTTGSDGDDDTRFRVLARTRGDAVWVLALPLSDVEASVARLVRVEAVVMVVVLAVLGLVTWWVLRLGVRPVKRMTETAVAIADGDLSQRVPDVVPGTEAGELGEALNTMLGRIEGAFAERGRSEARLRQFVADASHELRTPVTTIRGYAELYRAGGLRGPGELDSALRRTEDEAVRMGSLVEDLLLLARLDQGRPLQREPVDLDVLARDAVRDAGAVDPDHPVTAVTAGGVVAPGDADRLRQVVTNLVGNARVHTPPGTAVEVRTFREGDRAVLEVADSGPGMPPEVAERAFERFYRADPARSRHQGGTGLGLAIVQATVDAHAGAVRLRTAPGQGTTVRVELPL
ncbi:MAG: sensor histidine kinase [Acidimicrobiales bacterium]|nr:sensor histidine kinase [Acidimicrobiales bacterium]